MEENELEINEINTFQSKSVGFFWGGGVVVVENPGKENIVFLLFNISLHIRKKLLEFQNSWSIRIRDSFQYST